MKKHLLVAVLASLALLSGCVERALVITSDPPGATVTVNQQWKGATPYVVPFKHYGVYDIWIEHPGIEENGRMVKFYPMHVGEPVRAPGYQYAGADFFSEVLLPTTLRDQHSLHYTLERVAEADDIDGVLSRAGQLRGASAARTRMRYDQDVDSGRYGSGNSRYYANPYDGVPSDAAAGIYHARQPEPQWTPPVPSEVPTF